MNVVLGLGCGTLDEPSATGNAQPTADAEAYHPAPPTIAIAAGGSATCALTSAGAVKCWGTNYYGQLGDGSRSKESDAPVDVVGLSSGVVAVAVGNQHACAVTSAGAVKCWGGNTWGQLGDGSKVDSGVPVDVVGLSSDVVGVSAGFFNTCAVTSAGAVKCWGDNRAGQLGDGSTVDSALPVDVVGLSRGAVSISVGGMQVCVVTAAGAVKCWGLNNHGELGDGTTTTRHAPVDVVGLSSGVAAISTGAGHTCALTAAGAVKCWGSDRSGQLGLGEKSSKDSPVPADVVGLASGVAGISAGGLNTCAVTTAGAAKCWGRNKGGAVGSGLPDDSFVPTDVVGLASGVRAISASGSQTCAITTANAVRCWGGQYGPFPVDVRGF